MAHSPLTNPLVASYTTDFIRAVLRESIIEVVNRGGRIVSCTTDGFITDLPGLDTDPSFCKKVDSVELLRFSRAMLSGDPSLLE